MMRRRFPASRFVRKQPHWLWIRSNENNLNPIVPPAFASSDLLANYRTQSGIGLTLPAFTIWRIRIQISIRLTTTVSTTLAASTGVLVSLLVDDMNDPGLTPVTQQYSEKYLLWDTIYAYESVRDGWNNGSPSLPAAAPPPLALYKSYDLKGHRKIENIGESLMLQVAPVGGVALTVFEYSFQQATLVRLRD